jgi:predicted dehydrogenase
MATRLGLIGRGRWAHNIERTLLSFSDVSVAMVGRGEPLGRDIDGVLIASPSATHAEVALPFIERGITTFVEKPMATSSTDARRIREAAERTHAAVFVGHVHLYNPAFSTLLEMLPSLGAIYHVLSEGTNGTPRNDSSVLWDWLPHDLSMARAIFGSDPVSVQAWNLTDPRGCDAAVSRYSYGAASLVSMMSWLSAARRQRLTIAAERSTLVFDDRAAHKVMIHDQKGNVTYPRYDPELPLTRELRQFLNVVRGGSFDTSHIALGSTVVEAIVAAEKSIANGGVATRVET